MKTLLNSSFVTAIGIAVVVAAIDVPAYAGQSSEPGIANSRSLTVPYSDLDLSRQDGIDALYGKLRAAASKVCAPKEDLRNLALHRAWKDCYNKALDDAVAAIDHVGLSQVHLARTGRRNDAGQEVAGSQ